MGILSTGYGETLMYTILPRVKRQASRLAHGFGCKLKDYTWCSLGAVHPSGNTIDTDKPSY